MSFKGFFFIVGALSLVIPSFAHESNNDACMTRLGQLVSPDLNMTETNSSDGHPLNLFLSNFDDVRDRITSRGEKQGDTFGIATGTFSVRNCQLVGGRVSFSMVDSNPLTPSVNISERGGNEFEASADVWGGGHRFRIVGQ